MARGTHGHTLVEMLIALAVVAVVAGIAARGVSGSDAGELDAAVGEVVGALRFAQAEALRTQAWHGVDFGAPDNAERRIRVFRMASDRPTVPVFDVRHPIDKALYDIALSTRPGTGTVTLGPASFHYRTASATLTREWVAFDENGMPDYYLNADAYAAYGDAVWINAVLLVQAGRTRQVLLDPVTGRVSAP